MRKIENVTAISEAIASEYSLSDRRQIFTVSNAVRFSKTLSWSEVAKIAEELEWILSKMERSWSSTIRSCPFLMPMAISKKMIL
jgi:hypothetical protein